MKIAVISDTHDVLRGDVLARIQAADAVIHAGDFCCRKVYDGIRERLRPDAEFFCVQGNNDHRWAPEMPLTREFELEKIRFFLVHDRMDIPALLPDCGIIVFGHSHKYLEEEADGIFYLNPGACGRRRFRQELSMAELTAKDGKFSVEKILLEGSSKSYTVPGNKLAMIEEILRRMNKGQSIGQIAGKMHLDPELVEMICRIRVTHPGVSANGILDKWEANENLPYAGAHRL